MEKVKHTANTCNVGYTSIHAVMTPDDMRWLLKQVEGTFTVTSYVPNMVETPDEFEAWIDSNTWGKQLPFYFTFKFDSKGLRLLQDLNIQIKREHPWGVPEILNINN